MAATVATKPRLANIDTGLATSTIQPGMLTARRIPRSANIVSPPPTPTGFELSDKDTLQTIETWDEEKVAYFIRQIGCQKYEPLFKANHINGENLLQMDKDALKEVGVAKIGDRVRLSLSIKRLRSTAYENGEAIKEEKSKAINNPYRMSLAPHSWRLSVVSAFGSFSSAPPVPDMPSGLGYDTDLPLRAMSDYQESRPETPVSGHDSYSETASDMDSTMQLEDASMASGPAIHTPAESVDGSVASMAPSGSTLVSGSHLIIHSRNNPSIGKSLMTVLPKGHDIIRVIASGGVTKVIKVAGCTTCEQAMRITLRKFLIPEDHAGNYSFWALNSLDKLFGNSHRIGDTEFWHILQDKNRPERNRLILKRTGAGEPGDTELHRSAAIMIEEENHLKQAQMGGIDAKSMRKIQQLLGEKWQKLLGETVPPTDSEQEAAAPPPPPPPPPARLPSPPPPPPPPRRSASRRPAPLPLYQAPEQSHVDMINELELLYPELAASRHERLENGEGGSPRLGSQRPASEAITQDLVSFFPNHNPEEIDRTARMSMSRSKRLSKINSRLSVVSNFSVGSSINQPDDAPPVPSVPNNWLQGGNAHLATIYNMGDNGTRIPTIYAGRSSFEDTILSPMREQDPEYTAMSGSPRQARRLSDTALNDGTPIQATFFQDQENAGDASGAYSRNDQGAGIEANNDAQNKYVLNVVGTDDVVGESTSAQGAELFSSSNRLHPVESEGGHSTDGHASEQLDYGSDGELIRGADAAMMIQMRKQISSLQQALMADGEADDEELYTFISGESWDDKMWMKGTLIGKGSFGSVYLALHSVTGELMAVKQVDHPDEEIDAADGRKRTMADALRHEIALLRDLKHPHIVQYLGCSMGESMNIFLEYVAGGSVQSMLRSYGALPEPLIKSFVRQILIGLGFLHGRGIIHRDIKGGNILVDNKGIVKISDFGISKKLETSNILCGAAQTRLRPSMQGSVFWMAPEVVKQTTYTSKADIWSLGCLVVEMMTGSHPYPDCSQLQAIFKIGGGRVVPTIPSFASGEASDFLGQTFEMNQNVRPAADELLLCPFLKTDEEKEAERLEAQERKKRGEEVSTNETPGSDAGDGSDGSSTVQSDGTETYEKIDAAEVAEMEEMVEAEDTAEMEITFEHLEDSEGRDQI